MTIVLGGAGKPVLLILYFSVYLQVALRCRYGPRRVLADHLRCDAVHVDVRLGESSEEGCISRGSHGGAGICCSLGMGAVGNNIHGGRCTIWWHCILHRRLVMGIHNWERPESAVRLLGCMKYWPARGVTDSSS